MSNTLKLTAALVATALVSIVVSVWLVGGNQSANQSSPDTQTVGDAGTRFPHGIFTVGNIVQTVGATIVNQFVQADGGYSLTLSTANGTSFTVTPGQWCLGTQALVPVSNTTTITVTFPAASTTFAACGATAGSWSTQIIDNESSFPVTIATSTGGNGIVFFLSTSTTNTLYPPKIFASTTETQIGSYTSSTGLNLYRTAYFRAPGLGL